VKVETDGAQHEFEVQVNLNGIDPEAVRVELYTDGVGDRVAVRQQMKRVRQLVGATNDFVYRARVSAAPRPATDYTVRLIPHHDRAVVPLEAPHILWQR
jgi:starch phosphorylase